MFEVIRDVRENGIVGEELERTKIEVMGRRAIRIQTNGQLAAEAAFDELYGLGYDRYKDHDAAIRSITEEDIRRVAAEVFDLESYTIVSVGNLGSEAGAELEVEQEQ
jgi:predicted Zn-dependent peptidase